MKSCLLPLSGASGARLGPAGLGESVGVPFVKECAGAGKANEKGSRSRQAAGSDGRASNQSSRDIGTTIENVPKIWKI